MTETSLSTANAHAAIGTDLRPGSLIRMLLRKGLASSPTVIGQGSGLFPEALDWTAVCAVAYRCRIAPVTYQCLRSASLSVPTEIMTWFRAQYYETVTHNTILANDLRELLGWLSDAAIAAIVFKGPVLAHLGLGIARVSTDLDILIHEKDLPQVDAILCGNGYAAVLGPKHDYHKQYVHRTASRTSLVEVHVDICDGLRHYRPDIAGIWDRSMVTSIFDVSMRVPDLSDHLLLAIMQLPHHHWSIRLLVDLWQVVLRWGNQIDWQAFLDRAESWKMIVLTRSALHALTVTFDVSLPPAVRTISSPSGYLERVQWRVAESAIADQLAHPFRPRAMWVVPYLMVDQIKLVPSILMGRSFGVGGPPGQSPFAKAARRNAVMVSTLPVIAKIFLTSIARASFIAGRRQ